MALIKCSECGKNVSDKAKVCIHCGAPIEEVKKNNTTKVDKDNKIRKFITDRKLKIIDFKGLDVVDYGGILEL